MATEDEGLQQLLRHIKETRGFDFTGYKRTSLGRRLQRRMDTLRIASYEEYLDHLQANPQEYGALFNTLLINVTEFFRDPETWTALREKVVPEILRTLRPTEPVRVWVAGCASGEEAYSIAMVLAEALGPEDFRERVKIYATDVDDEALSQARQASYPSEALAAVPPDLQERYFEPTGDRLVVRRDLRRAVILGRNDLVQDAPISRVHLLLCRNVLMYLNADTQARVLRRFHFALAPQGVLVLGKAEMVLGHESLLAPYDARRRLFRRAPQPPSMIGNGWQRRRAAEGDPTQEGLARLAKEAVLGVPMPAVVVTNDGRLVMASRQAEVLFGIPSRDLGRPVTELEVGHWPGDLRRLVEQAGAERRTVRVPDVEWLRGTEVVHFEIQATPLVDAAGTLLGTSVVFHDTSRSFRLRRDFEAAVSELDGTREELQSTVEELETTNEELQSTVEELETTNEELQSTVEELETTNEELQSTNDELQTINEDLRERTDELDDLNTFLGAVVGGVRAGVVVVDVSLMVLVWSRRAEDQWGLRADEVAGQHLLGLDVGFAVHELALPVRQVVAAESPGFDVTMPGVNRRGRDVQVRILGDPIRGSDGRIRGALLAMTTDGVDAVDGRAAHVPGTTG